MEILNSLLLPRRLLEEWFVTESQESLELSKNPCFFHIINALPEHFLCPHLSLVSRVGTGRAPTSSSNVSNLWSTDQARETADHRQVPRPLSYVKTNSELIDNLIWILFPSPRRCYSRIINTRRPPRARREPISTSCSILLHYQQE